jgi:outer membrane protein OmpA-like peptidoglycan-associated protein
MLSAALLVVLALSLEVAYAQSVRLDRYRASELPSDGFAVRRLGEIGHLRVGLLASADFARDPLIVTFVSRSGASEERSVVQRMTMGKADLSLSLWDRWLLFAGLDGSLRMRGQRPPPLGDIKAADGPGLGDVSLGSRARFLGTSASRFGLGFQGALIFPIAGNERAYRGERRVSGRADLIVDLRVPYFHAAFNAGVLIRHEAKIGSGSLGSDALSALALGFPVHERVELLVEGLSSLGFRDFGARATTHLEWLAGLKGNFDTVYASVAAGTGLSKALGTPEFRVVWQAGMLSAGKSVAKPSAPAVPPPPSPEAEPDQDADGLIDRRDDCVSEPEDRDGFRDRDGCPDPDNDHDGIPDEQDACVNQPEDVDGFEDENGCAEQDNDGDGVLDVADACPLEPGTVEERGCKGHAQLTGSGEIRIDQQVQFETGKDVILGQSYDLLEAVRKILAQHGEIKRMRIEGHTDSRGNDLVNLKLSKARARAVARWFVQRGVDDARLTAYGCGEQHPLTDNASESGRSANRRVAFQVLDPIPSDALRARPLVGCESAFSAP